MSSSSRSKGKIGVWSSVLLEDDSVGVHGLKWGPTAVEVEGSGELPKVRCGKSRYSDRLKSTEAAVLFAVCRSPLSLLLSASVTVIRRGEVVVTVSVVSD